MFSGPCSILILSRLASSGLKISALWWRPAVEGFRKGASSVRCLPFQSLLDEATDMLAKKVECGDDEENTEENSSEFAPALGRFRVELEVEAYASRSDVADDAGRAYIVLEHPEGVAPDDGFNIGPEAVLEGLEAGGAKLSQGGEGAEVGGFEGFAVELAEVADAVEGEGDDTGERVGADYDDGEQGPEQAGYGADDVEGHAYEDDDGARSKVLGGPDGEDER